MDKLVRCRTCGANIAKSAKVCPYCGAKNRKRHPILGTILVILGIILFVNGIENFDTSSDGKNQTPQKSNNSYVSSDTSEDTPVDEEEPQNKSTISKDEFNSISTGMTYDEVVEIIGSEGEVLSEVDLDLGEEFKAIMYFWEGEGSPGANANITFQGGKVTAKAQIGLK